MEQANNNRIEIFESVDPSLWNSRAVHPMQSWQWGQARMETGVTARYFGEYEEGELKNVFLVTVHRIPKTPFFIGYVARSSVPSREVVSYLYHWARKEKIIFIKWEPYTVFEEAAGLSNYPHMRLSDEPLFTEWNLEVDLRPTEEEIFAHFRKNTRYAIRLAEKAGVEAKEETNENGFETFSNIYFQTVSRQGYHGHTRSYHRKLWKHLGPAGIAKLFIASVESIPQSAFEMFFFGDRAYYPYSGSIKEGRSLPVTELLMWRAIQAAKAAGKTTLDLWGALPPEHDAKHPWSGFTHWKLGFGSAYVHMSPSYDLVAFPGLFFLYRIAYKARKAFWKLRA